MIKKLIPILSLLLTLTLVGCNEATSETPKDQTTNSQSSQDNNKNTSDNENSSNNNENKTPVTKEDIKLSLYDVDINTYKILKDDSITFKGDTPIEDILKEISKTLSTKYFDNLPIEFIKIEKENNKKIAVINLNESAENKGKSIENFTNSSWANGYFQGSTGGIMTSKRLIENFLQNDYKGNWIDGVRFTYNNKPIEEGHVEPLSKTCYRY
ncbi:MAG: hypothetical protein ACRC2K_09450 [Clostridium sp.]